MDRRADDRTARILAAVDSIPAGTVRTYGEVAADAGLPRRARLVGSILRAGDYSRELPWHRVVGAGGSIRTEGRSRREQERRLRSEGLRVVRGRVRGEGT